MRVNEGAGVWIAFYRHVKMVLRCFCPRMRGACLRVSYDFADEMRLLGKEQEVGIGWELSQLMSKGLV